MLSQTFPSGSGSAAVGTLQEVFLNELWNNIFPGSCYIFTSCDEIKASHHPFTSFSLSNIYTSLLLWIVQYCILQTCIMPWSSGCSIAVVFGGKNLTLMLGYSLVMWEGALSMRRNVAICPISTQGQLQSSTHCCCGSSWF